MKRELALALAAELESGKHKQTANYLCRLDDNSDVIGRCCLGVACWMTPGIEINHRKDSIDYNGYSSWLPPKVIDYFGFYNSRGARKDGAKLWLIHQYGDTREYANLGEANDGGVLFIFIAAYIRDNYEFL